MKGLRLKESVSTKVFEVLCPVSEVESVGDSSGSLVCVPVAPLSVPAVTVPFLNVHVACEAENAKRVVWRVKKNEFRRSSGESTSGNKKEDHTAHSTAKPTAATYLMLHRCKLGQCGQIRHTNHHQRGRRWEWRTRSVARVPSLSLFSG